ncbi:hypothetical protein [Desulfovulcanus sp.]
MESIKRFAREVLGCGCPEEVFKDIEYDQKVSKLNDTCHVDRILIGRRLLIYLLRLDEYPELKEILPELIKEGKKERDRNSYNRFRLVVVTDDPELSRFSAKIFETISWLDEKIHLHVVSPHLVMLDE